MLRTVHCRGPAGVILAMALFGCAPAPKTSADLVAFDTCSSPHDAAHGALRDEVAQGLSRGHAMTAVVGGLELASSGHNWTFPTGSREARYLSSGDMRMGYGAVLAAAPRLRAIRSCLVSRGYTFTDGR
jgi:hypothetical protein